MKDKSNRGFWNRLAGCYDAIAKRELSAYSEMYALMRERLTRDMHVLELATGTGLISLAISDFAGRIEATDFSPRMIEEAKKKPTPENVFFSVQDACSLPYPDESFDCVIISNALHIIPDPELALANIKRVLKDDGVLIAPTFIHADNDKAGRIKAKLMELFGFRAYHKWTEQEYHAFLENNGFRIKRKEVLKSDFPLAYVEVGKSHNDI